MSATHLLIGVFQLAMTVILSVLVVYFNYRLFQHTNPDYDQEKELAKGNSAVAVLLAGMIFSSGMMIQKSIYPIVSLFRLWMTTPLENTIPLWQMILYGVCHVVMAFVLSTLTLSFSLRFFGRLTGELKEGQELKRGNVSVGILLASVVLVIGMYVSEGLGALSKSLIPQPSIGRVQFMK